MVVFLDVILLVVLLLLSVPLPFCFGGALLFMALFSDINMKALMPASCTWGCASGSASSRRSWAPPWSS